MDPKQIKAFLDAIQSVESSSGKNTKHAMSTKGVNYGEYALGKYGMEPNTMQEMLKRNPSNPYSDLKNADLSNIYHNEQNPKFPDALKRYPGGIEQATAEDLARHVLERQQGDVPNAIGSWLTGHNQGPAAMTKTLKRSPAAEEYVEKALPVYEKNFPKINDTIDNEDEEDDGTQFPLRRP